MLMLNYVAHGLHTAVFDEGFICARGLTLIPAGSRTGTFTYAWL